MKKLSIILISLVLYNIVNAQTYILNEDFATASGITAPGSWSNTLISGETFDKWHFDNPANRLINFPISGTFAIFDSENYSDNGVAEDVVLQSPSMDCSVSSYIFLYFDHFYAKGTGATGTVEVYDGSVWHTVATYTDSTNNAKSERLNLSSYAGGVTNAAIRFRFSGNGQRFWAIDNIKIYAPLALDAGLFGIPEPAMPMTAGTHDIKVNLRNYGAQNITSATIQWSINDAMQTPYNWSGTLVFDETEENITLGSYTFPAGGTKRIKSWVEDPNSNIDLDAYNDTVSKYVYTELCGTYTIGGTTPDFYELQDAIDAMTTSGIGCDVVFKIRPGIYEEQLRLNEILGNNANATITFESETGDSADVKITNQVYDPYNDFTIKLNGVEYISFKNLTIDRLNGDTAFVFQNKTHHLILEGNHILKNIFSPNTSCNHHIVINNNTLKNIIIYAPDTLKADSIIITNNTYQQSMFKNLRNLRIVGNIIHYNKSEYATQYGVLIENTDRIIIENNDINIQNPLYDYNVTYHTYGVKTNNSKNLNFKNNIIYAYRCRYGNSYGIYSTNDSIINSINDNISTNVYGSGQNSIEIIDGHNISIKNDTISCANYYYGANGIVIRSATGFANIDSCYIHDVRSNGIYINNNAGASCNITNNHIQNILEIGIQLDGANILVENNTIHNITEYEAVRINANNVECKNNIIYDLNGTSNTYTGYRCYAFAIYKDTCLIENNTIYDVDWSRGLYYITGHNNICRNNIFTDVHVNPSYYGAYISGNNNLIQNDNISEIEGRGFYISGGNNQILNNIILKQSEGFAMYLYGANNLIANNFFQSEGIGVAGGLTLGLGATGSKFVFNSINVNSTDEQNGIALKIEADANVLIKNNIFSNSGNGYAAYFTILPSLSLLDYNDYYSFNSKYYLNGSEYTDYISFKTDLSQEANGFGLNPFYTSNYNLIPTQGLFDNKADTLWYITHDIDGVLRNDTTPDIGAIEFNGAPCDPNSGLVRFIGLTNPLSTGNLIVKVEHVNYGTDPLTQDSIYWQVNGIAQTPISWTGNLDSAEVDTVTLGIYNTIESPNIYSFKAWTSSPNNLIDCSPQNDTIWKNNLGTKLCGTYTVGWDTADFANLNEVQVALNNGGITCDVTFILKDTIFYEQLRLDNITGNADTATITFQSYGTDSSHCEIRYTQNNPTNDYVVKLNGADYVTFKNIRINRNTNQYEALRINNSSNFARFENCWIVDDIISEPTSLDENISFINCKQDNGSIDIRNPQGTRGQNYLFEGCKLQYDIYLELADSITLLNTNLRRLTVDTANVISIDSSYFYWNGDGDVFSIDIEKTLNVNISHNYIYSNGTFYDNSRGITLHYCKNINISENDIYSKSDGYDYHNSYSVFADNCDNTNITGNNISADSYHRHSNDPYRFGIKIQNSNSITIQNDTIDCVNHDDYGYGIHLQNNTGNIAVQNCQIKHARDNGIYLTNNSVQTNISYNYIDSCGYNGIYADNGNGGSFYNNTIKHTNYNNNTCYGIRVDAHNTHIYNNLIDNVYGNGIYFEGNGSKLDRNRILNIEDGIGVLVNGTQNTIINNWITSYGIGTAIGAHINTNALNSIFVNNSINNFSTNANSRAFELSCATTVTIKNNIFANTGQGYATYYNLNNVTNNSINNNCYYSSTNKIGYFAQANKNTFSEWQIAISQDVNSYGVNPFYEQPNVLKPNQGLINDVAESFSYITTDIMSAPRSATPDIGAIEFNAGACSPNAGLNDFVGISNPLPLGVTDIKMALINQSPNSLDSVTIEWTINNIAQTPFSWYGNLVYNEIDTVTVGSYNFTPGIIYNIKAWINLPNDSTDCNNFNDTIKANGLGTTLCGIYTIGGTNPDFVDFDAAEYILSTAGISCNVVFNVRDGIYNNQLKLDYVPGLCDTATITFQGESQDSSLAVLQYSVQDNLNDFTVKLNNIEYISFNNLGIKRVNGYTAIVLNNSHNILFENNWIKEDIYSGVFSLDSNLVFRNNNIETGQVKLLNDSIINSKGIVFDNNNIQEDIFVTNTDSLKLINNTIRNIVLNKTNNLILKENIVNISCDCSAIATQITNSNNIKITNNSFSGGGTWYDPGDGLDIVNCNFAQVDSNTIYAAASYNTSRALYLKNSNNISVSINTIQSNGSNTRKSLVIENSDSIYVSQNNIHCTNTDQASRAIEVIGTSSFIKIDTNQIHDTKIGIYTDIIDDNLEISRNNIYNTSQYGMELNGKFGHIYKNKFYNLSQNALKINIDSAKFELNNIYDIVNSNGIVISGIGNLIYNNSVYIGGTGMAKGFVLQTGSDRNRIYFNSVSITSMDPLNAMALEVTGGTNNTIKNNIFSNVGGGYALYVDTNIVGSLWDYNNHYSSSGQLGYYLGNDYNNENTWAMAITGDANSISMNPYFVSNYELRPYQRAINGAGIPIAEVLLDFDNEIRNNTAPDIGADEFTVDFGVTELLSPLNNCGLTGLDTIKIMIRQFGDIPFENIRVAYQINEGAIYDEIISGSTFNDIEYSFNQLYDFSTPGTYNIKAWILAANDDNIANDTLYDVRHNAPIPQVNPSYNFGCYGHNTQFLGNATISSGSIDTYLWEFGDADTSTSQNPIHIYDTCGVYTIHFYAYSDLGCYNDTIINDTILPLAQTNFTTTNECFWDTAHFINLSTITDSTYTVKWFFGDGDTSIINNPSHLYYTADTFNVTLHTINAQGCIDSLVGGIRIYQLPTVSFSGMNSNYCADAEAVNLIPSPIGGVFTGSGIVNDSLFPTLLTPANYYNILYTYHDGTCPNTDTQTVYIDTLPIVNFYGLETQYCFTAEDDTLTGTPYGGVYTGSGLTDSIFSPSSVTPNTYNIIYTFTDGNGCINRDTNTTIVSVASNPVITIDSIHNVSCFQGNDGFINLSITGGATPYQSYQWSNGQTIEDADTLQANTYYFTLTDNEGCRAFDTVEVTQPISPLSLQATSDSLYCYNDTNGTINLTVTGGTPNYNYIWGNSQTVEDPINLIAGTYFVTVTDSLGCTDTISHKIRQPELIIINFITDHVLCYGENTGYIGTVITGGVTPYTSYNWSNGEIGTEINNVYANNYYLTITDTKGCIMVNSTVITQADTIIITDNHNEILCENGNDGIITVNVVGGVEPYNYSWNNGETSENLNNLDVGIYTLTLTDANNCIYNHMVDIFQSVPSIVINDTITNVSCEFAKNGAISINIEGGTQPFNYIWSTDDTATTLIDSLNGSNYWVRVTDINGCVKEKGFYVYEPKQLKLEGKVTNVSCRDEKDGAINIKVEDGTSPYTFLWSNNETIKDISYLAPNKYIIKVLDANNCEITDSFIVEKTDKNCQEIPEIFTPNGDGQNDVWNIGNVHIYPNIEVEIFNRWGILVFKSNGYNEPWDGTYNGKKLPMDAYYYVIYLNKEGHEILKGIVSIVR